VAAASPVPWALLARDCGRHRSAGAGW